MIAITASVWDNAADIGVPVVVAALTAIVTTVAARASEATNRRRDRYAEAVATLVAWIEFPYRVRRRTCDEPAALSALAGHAHDLQERLACHQTWIATEHPAVAEAYARARATITACVGPAIAEAWAAPPVTSAAGMNLGDWGPAGACHDALLEVQHGIEQRFGYRRLRAALRRRQ